MRKLPSFIVVVVVGKKKHPQSTQVLLGDALIRLLPAAPDELVLSDVPWMLRE